MNILLIHQAFVSPNEAGGTRHYELARCLLDRDVRFTIVASDLSYLSGQRVTTHTGLVTEQQIDGIRVLRAYTIPALHRSFFHRLVSYLSFMLTAVWAALRAGPADLVIGTTPPIFQAVSAWVVALLRRKPLLLEVRDLWPAFAIDMGVLKNPILIWLARRLERFLYARAAHIVVNSPAYRDHLIAKGIPAHKISLIPNGVDTALFDPQASGDTVRAQFGLSEKFAVVYAGAMGQANDLGTLLRAADRLRGEPEVHFLIVGDGKERPNLEAQAAALHLPNVTFAGPQPKSAMPGILAAADACVAILQNIPMFRTTYPNKVFDYMAAARPTVLAIDGVIRQVVEAAGGGVFVPPGDDAALAEAVLALSRERGRARQMGAAAREYVVRHFDRRQQAEQFAALAQQIVHKQVRGWNRLYRHFGKRVLDLTLTIPALIVLLPTMLVVALAVRIKLGAPVLFHQQRPGLNEQPFTLFKFRTMTDARDTDGKLLPDAARLTPLGQFLRRASLDELPTLFNVLRGEMSLVGPRPLLMRYLNRYTPEQARRHEVKPGVTGWAQVNGRNALSWEEKFALDVWYVDHLSLRLDLTIIFLTILKVLRREGINHPGQATMEEFIGSH